MVFGVGALPSAAGAALVPVTAKAIPFAMTPRQVSDCATDVRFQSAEASQKAGTCKVRDALSLGMIAGSGVALLRHSRLRKARTRPAAAVGTQGATTTVQKKDLTGALPDCPPTIWKADNINIDAIPDVAQTAPLIIDAAELEHDTGKGKLASYFTDNRTQIMQQLQEHGAILFRNFDLMQDAAGFRTFYESLELNPCLDPIHTSGLREMVDKKDAVYEAVNKPSLAKHFVGLHNESTFVKTAMFGAFVCFKPASEGGGEFIIADGAKIIKDMDPDVLRRIYENKVRISVSNLDLNFIDALPSEGLKDSTKGFLQDLILKAVAPKFDMDLEMVYGADKTNPYRLQAIEHAQSPINTHPVTGQPVWFCNIHNHSRYLRDRRPCTVPEVGMTDVYYGDLSRIPPEDVEHINKVCERNVVDIMMQKGDVVLLDNYRVLHGRRTFSGSRNHAVTWFESCGEPVSQGTQKDKPDDFMNTLINKTLV